MVIVPRQNLHLVRRQQCRTNISRLSCPLRRFYELRTELPSAVGCRGLHGLR